ncbi:penicillin-binding protein 1B [Lysobacter pythonis]|uniref:Penicillin-binding protein 1B n=1 Tax=Solilutibacter pythonis TaxID=2483112 RepID=A0A3M2HZE8_9GAMM|nr:penicillin-binding protein 1B [Lysobacter pythonis]RMH93505.1 penicillin-binding protein 1B [Lysobacter pythonis]
MAKYDYDDPDHEGDIDEEASPRSPWLRRLLVLGLGVVGIGLGFLVPYTLYLNHQVSQRFGQLQWQLPTRVYARPLQLEPGIALDAATLKTELDAAAYREDGEGAKPGTYARQGSGFTISSRGYFDVEGRIAPQRISVGLSGGRVASVRKAEGAALKAARLDPARIATLYGRNQEERRLVQLNEVPEKLITGLQAVEDRDFARHHGIDPTGMIRAVWVSLRSGGKSLQGGSTLTQQVARSGLLDIGKEVTPARKFKEILYALILEARYDKRTILETYFNQVYWGQRGSQAIHGVSSASEFWFNRSLDQLTTEQIALLIAIVNGPSYYDPRRNPGRAKERRDFVLGKMRENNVITQAEHDTAVNAPLGVSKEPGGAAPNRFPAYVDLVRRQLVRDYPADSLQGAGLAVMTAMSPAAQGYAEGAVTRTMKSLGQRRKVPLEAGLVITDVQTGQVVAAVGSKDFANPGFNRALEARRPVGSIIKPFVYMLALAQPGKWSLASYIDDSPLTIRLGNGRRWAPGNADGRSHGTVRMIDALAQSYNLATVRVGMEVGPERVAELIRTLAGIEPQSNPSLLLGAMDQSPYAMAQLYQFLASGGEVQPLHAVRGVLDPKGRALNRYDKAPAPAQKGDAVASRLITIALQQAVSSGTARQLVADGLGRLKPAGKTGTSNDSRDSWFAGWTGDHLAVIWVGNDDNKPTGLYGSTGAMRVWSGIFSKLPSRALEVGDEGLDWQWVSGSGATDASCPGARRFAFVSGYAPAWQPCAMEPPPLLDEFGNPIEPAEPPAESESRGGGWREFFGIGRRSRAPEPASAPPPSR